MNLLAATNPPEYSGRFLVEFEEFGLQGRYFSTATYWHLDSIWQIDNKEMRNFTVKSWMEIKTTPLNLE